MPYATLLDNALRFTVVVVLLAIATPLCAADPFEFKDGDRVVFLGSTLVEREQKYGYWELALTMKNAEKNVKFRNLGWSGDTVWGEARNGFDQTPKGYERLVKVTIEAKPTVIVICYGQNESFAGEAGVPRFLAQLEKLLIDLTPTKARIVLMSPTPFEKAGPITDPDSRNKNLARYRDAMKGIAEKRNLEFVDLYERVRQFLASRDSAGPPTMTENGIHFAAPGYEWSARIALHDVSASSEQLRQKIIEKNQLVFHQWRPQNETYLFLFRKHEQGNNAKDIPAFDPLIAMAEKEIQELKSTLK